MTSTYYADQEVRPRKRRGRRVLITFLVLLIVLGGLIVVGDRVAANFAEKKIAEQVSQEVAAQNAQSAPPEVTIGGFPFLTQVLAGDYERISIVMRDVKASVEGNSVTLPVLDIQARNVKASIQTLQSGQGEVVAQTIDGTGTISYASVAELVQQEGVELTERDGKLIATASVPILGQQFTLTGAAQLAVKGEQIQIRFEDVTAEGLPNVPAARQVIQGFARNLAVNIDIPDLPFQLSLREVKATSDGLAVTASAENVPLSS